jgi:antitoxin (DNA-binding transcriptional repressor) of toxin-antitoxin stability system
VTALVLDLDMDARRCDLCVRWAEALERPVALTVQGDYVQLEMNLVETRMTSTINAKRLRASLPEVVARVRKGAQFTVLYRSRPAFRIVPVDHVPAPPARLTDEPLYRAGPVGRSRDRRTAAGHDTLLYPR